MVARKLILGSLLVLACAASASTPNAAEAGSGGGYRGAHVNVAMNWRNAYGQTYQTRLTCSYWYVLGGLSRADLNSIAYHVRNMNAQGYYCTSWRYEFLRSIY
jgi:hypothetical protein